MEIKLSAESGDVLTRVEGMKRWHVMPTMTRGSKQAQKGVPRPKADHVHDAETSKAKRQKKNPVKANLLHVDIGAEHITRSQSGAETIRTIMTEIQRLDESIYSAAKMFEDNGTCRMKFEGASLMNWETILEKSPEAFSAMYLDSHRLSDVPDNL